MGLTRDQAERYSRHLLLPQIGREGQQKLLDARVLLVGAGGLGSPAALYLAAAGVGTIGLVDNDVVDRSNLQRQILHSEDMVGKPKLESARARLASLNSDLRLKTHDLRLDSSNAMEILAKYDVIVDGTDNFPTRYLTNDACVLLGKPNVYGAIYHFEGQASVFDASRGPCYRCLFPEPPPPGEVPSCEEAGVLGILPGIIGLIQATEAIKLILGIGETLAGRLLLYDALRMEFRTVRLKRNPQCPMCGESRTIHELIDYEGFCNAHAPRKEYAEMNSAELKRRLERGERLVLLDVRNQDEFDAGHIPGTRFIPLPDLPDRLAELDDVKQEAVVVYCARGGRSAKACGILKNAGFGSVSNLEGGFTEFSRK